MAMPNEMEVPLYKDIFKLINKYLYLAGSPLDGSSLKLIFYVHVISLIVMIILETGFLISRFSAENFLELTALAPCIIEGTVCLFKFLPIALKRQKVSLLIDSLEKLYEDIIKDHKRRILIVKETILVQKFTMYYIVLYWSLILLYCILSPLMMLYVYITEGVLNFMIPFNIILPFSYENWPNWILVFLFSSYNGFACVLFFVTVDALYYTLCSQVCCNFAVLCKDIRELNSKNADSLKTIVEKHQHLINTSVILNDVFTIPNMSNVLVGTVDICILGFNIMTDEASDLPQHLLFLFVVLLQILVMSFFGENIIRESQKVRDAAYDCDWISMNSRDRKIVLLIIARATKPQRLTACKFYEISYTSFTKIISTSWSYFTILRTIYKPAEKD